MASMTNNSWRMMFAPLDGTGYIEASFNVWRKIYMSGTNSFRTTRAWEINGQKRLGSRAEHILPSNDTVLPNPEKSKPIRNPSRIPPTMRSANSLSGWVCSTCSHARQCHGVETPERKAGVGGRGDGCIANRLSYPVSRALRCPSSRNGTPAPAEIQMSVGGRWWVTGSERKERRGRKTEGRGGGRYDT